MASFKLRAVGGADRFDEGECRKSLALIWPPDEWREIRALPSGRCQSLQGDPDEVIKAIADLVDESVYWCINPIQPNAKHANKSTVLRRDWLLFDIDPVRLKGVSASDIEKRSASLVASRIVADLSGRGWPVPILIDSGNGYHLYYRIELPNDPLAQSAIKKALVTLAERHDTPEATIDRAVHDAPRIAKIPGTYARKGADTADRPHRLCRVLSVPSVVELVPWMLLSSLNDTKAPAPKQTTYQKTATDGPGVEAYARRALESEIGRLTLTGQSRNAALYEASLKLAGLVKANALDEGETRRALAAAASLIGLGTDGDPEEIARAIDNAFSVATPRDLGQLNASPKASQQAPPRPAKLTVMAHEVQPRTVDWLWRDRLAIGFLNVFAGRTGAGKSFVLSDFAARLSTGRGLPDGSPALPIGGTMFISEDPIEQMMLPRLIELGADRSRIGFMTWEGMAAYTLADTDYLNSAWEETGKPKLIVIDPPANFLGSKDEHKNAEIRSVLMRLVAWLDGHAVAMALITHYNKGGAAKALDALDRIMGSVAWASSSRVACGFVADPNDETKVIFAGIKNNLGPRAEALAFSIEKTADLATIQWHGPAGLTLDEALASKKGRGVAALEWITERFLERREWPSDELFAAGREAGVSRNSLFSPEVNALPIRKMRTVTAGGEAIWVWRATDPKWPPIPDQKNAGTVGTVGTVGMQTQDTEGDTAF